TFGHIKAQLLQGADFQNANGGVTLNIQDLTKHVKDKKVDELDLISMEGGSYVLHALVNGKSVPVQGSTG
ncbi:hypothetical protein APX70_05696, partial [Pseudomonas syringae pv. maculicola]